jgi:hypothetical protein
MKKKCITQGQNRGRLKTIQLLGVVGKKAERRRGIEWQQVLLPNLGDQSVQTPQVSALL